MSRINEGDWLKLRGAADRLIPLLEVYLTKSPNDLTPVDHRRILQGVAEVRNALTHTPKPLDYEVVMDLVYGDKDNE